MAMASLPSMGPCSLDALEGLLDDIRNGELQRVQDRLNERIDLVNKEYKKGKNRGTPLVVAIKTGSLDMIDLLIRNGADVEQCVGQYKDESPLIFAMKNKDVMKMLLDHCDVNKKLGKREFTPLHEAVDQENVDAVSLLVQDVRTNLNIQDQNNNSPLHLAVEKDKKEIVEALTLHPRKLDFNLQNNCGLIASKVNTDGVYQTCKIVSKAQKSLEEEKSSPRSNQPSESVDICQQHGSIPFTDAFHEDNVVFVNPPVAEEPRQDNVDGRGIERVVPDQLHSLNANSIPPEVRGPGPRPSEDDDLLKSPEQYSLAQNRSNIGSIPFQPNSLEQRVLVLPSESDEVSCSGNESVSTEEVRDDQPIRERLLHKIDASNTESTNEEVPI